ncbi:MAG: dihydrofolate reductase family protein [Nocardioides sp.]|uniref:dihydrofolate reductase family protein n=1 Tax=Nocardioides sp. TaxID=35761 RepID=UPI0039E2C97B
MSGDRSRALVGGGDPSTPAGLRDCYRPPRLPWLRANMVSSVDGGATGSDGRSGTVNTGADRDVFALLRSLAEVILVGAGTARVEGYTGSDADEPPIVMVTRRGVVPERARGARRGAIRLATVETAPGLAEARALLGEEHVYVVGETEVDLARLVAALHADGLTHILCEGGPSLLGDLVRAGLVDELCHTLAPRLLAGDGPRILRGPGVDVPLELAGLIETDGTLLARWLVHR